MAHFEMIHEVCEKMQEMALKHPVVRKKRIPYSCISEIEDKIEEITLQKIKNELQPTDRTLDQVEQQLKHMDDVIQYVEHFDIKLQLYTSLHDASFPDLQDEIEQKIHERDALVDELMKLDQELKNIRSEKYELALENKRKYRVLSVKWLQSLKNLEKRENTKKIREEFASGVVSALCSKTEGQQEHVRSKEQYAKLKQENFAVRQVLLVYWKLLEAKH